LPPYGKFYTFAILVYVQLYIIVVYCLASKEPVLQAQTKAENWLFICLTRCSVIGNLFLALVTATVSFRLDTTNKTMQFLCCFFHLDIAGQN
jgi:hypothetical protein